jgi:hypothetical protein
MIVLFIPVNVENFTVIPLFVRLLAVLHQLSKFIK